MKKIISLLMCLMVIISLSACGKKNSTDSKSASEKADKAAVEQQMDNDTDIKEKKSADKSEEKTDKAESDNNNAADVEQLPVESAEQLESMVDEFNNTDDPERKEELRKELEKILQQAEKMSAEN